MEESYKEIIGYEGLYRISNRGTIINKDGKEKKLRLFKNGYLYVSLWKGGKSKTLLVHRLVSLHFINNNECKNQVNHKNGIKTDNRVENLEWCTDKENKKHAVKLGLFHKGVKHHNSKKVIDIKTGVVYDNVKIASKILNINYSTLRAYLNGSLTNKTNLIYA